jgi:hypothetical protein
VLVISNATTAAAPIQVTFLVYEIAPWNAISNGAVIVILTVPGEPVMLKPLAVIARYGGGLRPGVVTGVLIKDIVLDGLCDRVSVGVLVIVLEGLCDRVFVGVLLIVLVRLADIEII